MKDAIGQEINIGDILFYGQTSRYAEFMQLRVDRLTPATIVGTRLSGDRPHYGNDEVRVSATSHCIVITKLLNTEHPKEPQC